MLQMLALQQFKGIWPIQEKKQQKDFYQVTGTWDHTWQKWHAAVAALSSPRLRPCVYRCSAAALKLCVFCLV